MSSAILIDRRASGLQPLACDMPMTILHQEIACAEASILLSGEICWRGFTFITDCDSDLIWICPDACGVVGTKAKGATALSDCISEWNIRDP
jgi:hypothetical protein